MSEELKPCPFCGSKEVYTQTFTIGGISNNWLWNVKCTEQGCFAEGPICNSEKEAISAWNRRK